MTDLRRYALGDILDATSDLRQRFEAGILNTLQFALELNQFRFRDNRGDHWYLDARTNQWYRFNEGQWQSSSTPPKSLEGPESLMINVSAPPEDTADLEDPFESREQWTPTEALETIVQTTRSAYEQGQISSMDTELLLARRYVVDKEGRFWTVGGRSGNWYYFEDGRWTMSDQPPEIESLLRLQLGRQTCDACGYFIEEGYVCPQCGADVVPELAVTSEQTYTALLQFLLLGAGTLPEQVTDPWDPPPGFPEALPEPGGECASCGATNPAGSRFCNQCGSALASEPALSSRFCRQCGNQVAPGKRFCTQCGTPLG